MKVSQRRELSEQVHRSTGAYELVFSPLLLALVGYGLDRWFGIVPVLTVIFALVGVGGAVTKIYVQYRDEMREHEANGPWAR